METDELDGGRAPEDVSALPAPDEAAALAVELFGPSARGATRWLVVAAHPDDESIGASFLLSSGADVRVLHLTDGAPEDRALWSPLAPEPREAYAHLRAEEAREALRLAGVPALRHLVLPVPDQSAPRALVELTRRLSVVLRGRAPELVLTHPYEGGHPDHDACAFVVHAACMLHARCTGKGVRIAEMTSYHRADGRLRTGAFLGDDRGVRRVLSPAGRALKRRMLEAHLSQREVLAPFFEAPAERFRRAPAYDFTRPPHPGTLHYESLRWRTTGAEFCALAREALSTLGLAPPREGPWA